MNRKILSKIIIAIFVLIPFSFFVVSIIKQKHYIAETHLQSGTALPHPQNLAPFQLSDMNGQSFTNKDLLGHWSLVFFGFTRCPAICRTSLAELAHAVKLLPPGASVPQIVFISIDPDHDSAQTIKKYVSKFNAAILGATGSPLQLEALTKPVGIMFAKIPTQQNYTMSHSDIILVVNPRGEWVAVLTPPHQDNQIANDLAVIQKSS